MTDTRGSGYGTTVLGADLTLAFTPETPAGSYTSALNVSAVAAHP